MAGWISMHRKILENPIICKDASYFAVWAYLLLNATHDKYDVIFRGKRTTLLKGQLVTSRHSISLKFGISESKVQRILKTFEIEQQIEQQTTAQNRLITILKWDLYQKSEQQNEQRVNNNWTTTEQQLNTNNNVNKEIMLIKDPTCADGKISHILSEYQKYLGDQNIKRQQEVLGYLEKGLDEDVIVECIRDSVTGDQPTSYIFGILDRCVQKKVFTLAQYIVEKKLFEDKRKQLVKDSKKADSINNFDQRDHTNTDFDKYYVDVTKED
jgi:hypothetical protein